MGKDCSGFQRMAKVERTEKDTLQIIANSSKWIWKPKFKQLKKDVPILKSHQQIDIQAVDKN